MAGPFLLLAWQVLLYNRSSVVPVAPARPKHAPRLPFHVDCIFLHEKSSERNCPQKVFDALAAVVDTAAQPCSYIFEASG